MTAWLQVAIAVASVAVLLGLMVVVQKLAQSRFIAPELQRKMVHVGTGLYALTLPWLFADRWPIYGLVGVTLGVMIMLRLPKSRLGATLHGVGRQSWGDLLLAIAVGACLFLAEDKLYLYVLPIAVLTLADAAAALAGTTYGSRFFKVEDGVKSVEGSAVFFVLTLLIAIICLMLMTTLAPANIIALSVLVAAFGTLVEAVSWRGFDNLFLPLALLIFLKGHATDPMPAMLVFAAIFALSIIVFKLVAPRFGLNDHAARVYVIMVFVLLAVTDIQNALFPVLVLAAHAWARTRTPCTARHPALDVVAGLALVSAGWLILGTATGWNAIAFYGMTAMGMMMVLCAIALSGDSPLIRLTALGVIAALACVLWSVNVAVNPAISNWNGPMWPVVLTNIALTASLPSMVPAVFAQSRVTKLTVLSLVLPMAAYLLSIGSQGFSA